MKSQQIFLSENSQWVFIIGHFPNQQIKNRLSSGFWNILMLERSFILQKKPLSQTFQRIFTKYHFLVISLDLYISRCAVPFQYAILPVNNGFRLTNIPCWLCTPLSSSLVYVHWFGFHKIDSIAVLKSCLTLCNPIDCSLPGSSLPGILQARILEWVAFPFSRGSSWPRNWTRVSLIAGRLFFTIWATREPLLRKRRWI